MLLPAEKDLRAVLARFEDARIAHDVRPSGRTSRALEDATYTLCVMTGSRTAEQAVSAAHALLDRYGADDRQTPDQQDKTLAA
ncbi:DUF5133 domain-containing protein [Streptomyces sp. NPDC002766]|jgi:hypothetical protein|uniref:DUF5133 domain-containing protein n=1 Tax=unclassified Streptomyces TaxID=2593676 RepID=UPI003331C83C